MRRPLLELALRAVKDAAKLEGITRIALIGSLTSDKRDPKDVDLLATVADDADLAPLAVIGRRLQGKAQAMGKGGEVFLSSEEGGYLGRICPWRECRPGIRQRCDAWHCGQRPHLHDDFGAIRLDPAVIMFPRIVLWPEVRVGGPVPEDVETILLAPLRGEQLQRGPLSSPAVHHRLRRDMTLVRWIIEPRSDLHVSVFLLNQAIAVRRDLPYLNYLSRQNHSIWITALVPDQDVDLIEQRYAFGDCHVEPEKSKNDPMLWQEAERYARCLHDTTSLAIDLLTPDDLEALWKSLEIPDPRASGTEAYLLEHSPTYQCWSPAQRDEYWAVALQRGPHPAMSPPTHWFSNLM